MFSIDFKVVVLPAPFRPINPVILPFCSSKEALSSVNPLYLFVSPSAFKTFIVPASLKALLLLVLYHNNPRSLTPFGNLSGSSKHILLWYNRKKDKERGDDKR